MIPHFPQFGGGLAGRSDVPLQMQKTLTPALSRSTGRGGKRAHAIALVWSALGSMSGKVSGSPFGARNFLSPGAAVQSMSPNVPLCPVFEEFFFRVSP
jgi:hypothetical protein